MLLATQMRIMRYYLAASLARSAAAFMKPVPRRRFSLAATKTDESRVAIGEVVLTEPGVAVIRDTAGVGGADVVAGSRLELSNGRQGTVVLTRSPLCVVCLDDDGDDAGVDDATLALRRMALRSGESGGEADAFMVGEMENSVDVTKLAGRIIDAFGCDVDGQGGCGIVLQDLPRGFGAGPNGAHRRVRERRRPGHRPHDAPRQGPERAVCRSS